MRERERERGGGFVGINLLEREADHTPLCSVAVKNEWHYTSNPLFSFVLCRSNTITLTLSSKIIIIIKRNNN